MTSSQMRSKPKTPYLSGDSSLFVKRVVWRGWGSGTATGTGTAFTDDCKPNCAQGTFHTHPATIVLTDPKRWHRRMAYTRVTDSVPAIGAGQILRGLVSVSPGLVVQVVMDAVAVGQETEAVGERGERVAEGVGRATEVPAQASGAPAGQDHSGVPALPHGTR